MKKSKILLLVLLTFLLMLDASGVYAIRYRDSRGHWAEDYINQMSDAGFVTGYEGKNFKPESNISRAEFFSIINSMANLKKTYTVTFSDVSKSDWFYNDVSKAIKAGYLTPTTGKLNPNEPIPRQDVMRILGYMYGLKQNPKALSGFRDSNAFTSESRGYAGALFKLGILSGGNDGLLRPNEGISRAETCKLLFLLMDQYGLPKERLVVDSKIKFGDRNLYN
ncbi:MAG: S-layer homology domain-containing protein [Peptoniphilaceae bacterium]